MLLTIPGMQQFYINPGEKKSRKQCRTLPSTPTMASQATPLIPPDYPHHRSTKGPVIFTAVGLTGASVIIFIIVFCKYRSRAPVATGAGAAVSNPEERRSLGVDVDKLPEAFSFTESARRSGGGSHDDDAQCSVCLGMMQVGEMVRRLPLCKHLYHVECIDMWLASHTTCPPCRR
jgi:hypothetical protein